MTSKKLNGIILILLLLLIVFLIALIFFIFRQNNTNQQSSSDIYHTEKITVNLKNALKKNPQSIDSLYTEKVYLDAWNECEDPNSLPAGRETTCELLIIKLYDNYTKFKDKNFLNSAKEIYGFANKTLTKDQLDLLNSNLGDIKL